MILSAHQPVYLPWLGLFHKIALCDQFIFFDQVQYVPKDWINRNQVKSPNGSIFLTVPVYHKNHFNKKIAEIKINNEIPWTRKHLKTLFFCYNKSPFFKDYWPFFEDLYSKEWTYLSDLNFYILTWFLETLGITTVIKKAGNYSFAGTKSDLVLDMCLQLKATTYIFGELGKNYADSDSFKKEGINIVFQKYTYPVYNQLHGDYSPFMSIVDLLFNMGQSSKDIIMSGNTIKDEILKLEVV